jgi:hypothetical protein
MFDDRFVIESDGRVVGVAVRVRGGFMFFSSDPDLKELEARIFPRAKSIARRVAEFALAKRASSNQSAADGGNIIPLRLRRRGPQPTDHPPPPFAA